MRPGGKAKDKNECKITTTISKRELEVRIKEMGHKGFGKGNCERKIQCDSPASFEHGSKHMRFIISSMSHKNPVRQGYHPHIRGEESEPQKENNFSVVKWPFQGPDPRSLTLVYALNHYTILKKGGVNITTKDGLSLWNIPPTPAPHLEFMFHLFKPGTPVLLVVPSFP